MLHTHPYEEVFVTLEGEATFTVGDDTIEVSAGQIVVAPAGVPRHRDNHICKPAPTNTQRSAPATIFFALLNVMTSFRVPSHTVSVSAYAPSARTDCPASSRVRMPTGAADLLK